MNCVIISEYLFKNKICSGKPSKVETHPDYVPSVFNYKRSHSSSDMNRFERAKKRSVSKQNRPILTQQSEAVSRMQVEGEVQEAERMQVGAEEQETEENRMQTEAEAPEEDCMPEKVQDILAQQSEISVQENIVTKEMLEGEINTLRTEKIDLQSKLQSAEERILMQQYSPDFLKNNNKLCMYFTGLSWPVLDTLITFLSDHTIQKTKQLLPFKNQIILTLVKLRLNLNFEFLSLQLGLSISTAHKLFWDMVLIMNNKLKFLISWPDSSTVHKTIPPVFKKYFPRLTGIIDCFEIFIERPTSLKARAEVYSNYKKHSTIKYLIACSPLGAITFLSKGWGGRASDKTIVKELGFISASLHSPGDQILADRGFTMKDDFALLQAELIVPAFSKKNKQLTPKEIETTRKIASVRIHIERIIGLIKKRYTILNGPVCIQFVKNFDEIITLCAVLVNLSPSIVYREDDNA